MKMQKIIMIKVLRNMYRNMAQVKNVADTKNLADTKIMADAKILGAIKN
jgi:hypothetical protein